jgi:hypothetical protein
MTLYKDFGLITEHNILTFMRRVFANVLIALGCFGIYNTLRHLYLGLYSDALSILVYTLGCFLIGSYVRRNCHYAFKPKSKSMPWSKYLDHIKDQPCHIQSPYAWKKWVTKDRPFKEYKHWIVVDSIRHVKEDYEYKVIFSLDTVEDTVQLNAPKLEELRQILEEHNMDGWFMFKNAEWRKSIKRLHFNVTNAKYITVFGEENVKKVKAIL